MQVFLKGNPTMNALVASLLAVALIAVSFSLFEPSMTRAANPHDFTVDQTVGAEISFQTEAADITMNGTIQGITGGTSWGTTTFNVLTNNINGYTVKINFATATAMQGNNIATDIDNFTSSGGASGQYDWSVAVGAAEFGYTVIGETEPTTIAQEFKDNGADTCGGAFTGTVNYKCWFMASDATTQTTIVDSSSPTPGTGATSTLVFRIQADNPVPSLESGTYTATATLTAAVKP